MRRVLFIFLICLSAMGSLTSQARVVNSKEDLVRLRGFQAHQALDQDLNRQRLSDSDQVKRADAAREKLKQDALVEYKKERRNQKAHLSESSDEYRDFSQNEKKRAEQHERARQAYIQHQKEAQRESRATVNLSEEKELGIAKDPDRVDWDKRKFFADSGKGGTSKSKSDSGRFSGSPGGGQSEPPPPEFMGGVPPAPPPDFFEAEPPPPLPPPPIPPFYPGAPPGGFDDGGGMPPPAFDDPEF